MTPADERIGRKFCTWQSRGVARSLPFLLLIVSLPPSLAAPARAAMAGGGAPGIASVTLSRVVVPSSGGRVTLSVDVRNARTCFVTGHGPPVKLDCSSGHAGAYITIPASKASTGKNWTFDLVVRAATGTARRSFTIRQRGVTMPSIVSLTSPQAAVPWTGRRITVTAEVKNATTCLITGSGSTLKLSCSSGTAAAYIIIPRSSSSTTQRWTFDFVARASTGTARRTFTILQRADPNARPTPPTPTAPAPATTTPVSTTTTSPSATTYPQPAIPGLDICTPGPDCDYGPSVSTYGDYGDGYPVNLSDSTFAAVANWEQIVLGTNPDPSLIASEYAQAGGGPNGLTFPQLWFYFEGQGIDDVYLLSAQSVPTDEADIESDVRTDDALIVGFSFQQNDTFGNVTVEQGDHAAVVDGFTPEGPLVVTWGSTYQLTWQQWAQEVSSVWAISFSAS